MQFVKLFKDISYSEEHQKRPIKFSFARTLKDGRIKVLHKPVLCRDFLGDCLVWNSGELKFTSPIYEFSYHGKIDKDKVNLYLEDISGWENVSNPILSSNTFLVPNLAFLHKLEDEIEIPRTEIRTEDNKEFHVVANKWWQQTTVHFSYFTYLLRQLSYHKPITDWESFPKEGPSKNLSVDILKKLHLALKKLVVTSVSGTTKIYLDCDYDTMHAYNGFYSQLKYKEYTVYGNQLQEILNGIPSS